MEQQKQLSACLLRLTSSMSVVCRDENLLEMCSNNFHQSQERILNFNTKKIDRKYLWFKTVKCGDVSWRILKQKRSLYSAQHSLDIFQLSHANNEATNQHTFYMLRPTIFLTHMYNKVT